MLEIIHSSKLSYDNTKSWGSNHCISVYGQRDITSDFSMSNWTLGSKLKRAGDKRNAH